VKKTTSLDRGESNTREDHLHTEKSRKGRRRGLEIVPEKLFVGERPQKNGINA